MPVLDPRGVQASAFAVHTRQQDPSKLVQRGLSGDPNLAQHVILHFRSPPARSGLSPGSRANCLLTLGYRFDTQTIRGESYAAVVSNAPTPPRRRDTTPSAPPIS